MRLFCSRFDIDSQVKLLDVGGSAPIWELAPARPSITFVNLDHVPRFAVAADDFYIAGDATSLPFDDRSFGIAYSNSVIEHLSSYDAQRAFAAEVRRVGQSYFVQTPSRFFPIEPHLLGIGIHWLPKSVQRHLVRWTTVWGWVAKPDTRRVESFLNEVRLLTKSEMRSLFPDATILTERFLGLPKSYIAVRH